MRPLLLLFSSGLLLAALQCLFVREYLAVFQGNELVLGAVLAVWLCAVGSGSMIGRRFPSAGAGPAVAGLIVFGTAGIMMIRASRLLLSPGESIPPLETALIILATEFLPAFCGGAVFGATARQGGTSGELYGLENGGGVLGSSIVYGCVLAAATNGASWAVALFVVAAVLFGARFAGGNGSRKQALTLAGLACAAAVITLAGDQASMLWKYPAGTTDVVFGHDGEIARRIDGRDTTVFMNGSMYASTLDKPTAEQSVHLPMAQLDRPRRALILFDRGQGSELAKYPDLAIDRLETEPALLRGNARLGSPERLRPAVPYDVVLLGSGAPSTASVNRFYTTAFFAFVKNRLLASRGVFSFTLPFSENYLSPAETRLLSTLGATLRSVFPAVWIVPGNGYTFMASPSPLRRVLSATVPTEYLVTRILPAIDPERLSHANAGGGDVMVNTADRPVALYLALRRWMELYGLSLWVLGLVLVAGLVAAVVLLPKSAAVFSVGSSGLAVGCASITYLLLYQANYGALYAQIAGFMVMLMLGFGLGSLLPRFKNADLAIGLYVLATIAGLSLVPYVPPALFFIVNLGLGALAGAQFKSQQSSDAAVLYAADMAGGVFGMALSTTVLLPLAGATAVAAGLAGLKCVAWIVSLAAARKER